MCGFCGFTGSVYNDENNTVINKMTDKIIHRGPDSAGFHVDNNVTLGFRRLSIIGLGDGSQPMYNEDKSLVIVFNGEIYNYKQLRQELLDKGHVFSSHADTEVLIHLYEEHGEELLSYIRGMFAFVIYDIKNEKLFAARDFFGIKPFYYTIIDGQLVFGSEIKSIIQYPAFIKEVNKDALENYLTFQYSVLPETFFKGVFKLMPAHYLVYEKGNITTKRYWEAKFNADESTSLEETINNIDNIVEDSIKHHVISDVELGSFLSSGVDSSYVAAKFKGDKTFTVGFDYDDYNEVDYAKNLSKEIGIENYSKIISQKDFWGIINKVQYYMDEPLADPAAIPLYFVCNLASKHVKVALSGEGADELFGGYNIYKEPLDLKILTDLPMPIRKALGIIASKLPINIKGKNFFIRGSKTVEERYIGNARVFTEIERGKILKEPTNNNKILDITSPYFNKVTDLDDITKMQYIDLHLWMVGDILLKADKMSMANSLEVRVPYLDKEVFKVASKIPTNFRVNKTSTKYAFRMSSKKYLKEDVAKKKKLGFPVPIRIWLREEEWYSKVKTTFESPGAKQYFNTDQIIKYLDDHKNGKVDNSRKIWTIYIFLVWYEEFFIAM